MSILFGGNRCKGRKFIKGWFGEAVISRRGGITRIHSNAFHSLREPIAGFWLTRFRGYKVINGDFLGFKIYGKGENMSTKSTLFHTACCHIYKDKKYQHTESPCDGDEDVLVIDVSYQSVDYESYEDQDCIVVDWDSDFAEMIRVLLSIANHDELEKHLREHWEKNKCLTS